MLMASGMIYDREKIRMSKNVVWMYFTKVETDASKAQCKECNKLLSLGSDKPKFQTVSGLKGHLASCHKEIHVMYLKRAMNHAAERAAKKIKKEEKALSKHGLLIQNADSNIGLHENVSESFDVAQGDWKPTTDDLLQFELKYAINNVSPEAALQPVTDMVISPSSTCLPIQPFNITPSTAHQPTPSASYASSGNDKCDPANEDFSSDGEDDFKYHIERAADNKEDRFDIFGKNVAVKLRDLQIHQRILAEKLINDALYEAELGHLTESYQLVNYDQ
ncbi:unnamed protein product [Lymnaea stagnalis]|uniref:BED-type domain-containing protein n=1 Tax=Lymnaea stagnalis TaxID=6523 RepID=A0AAV2I8L9_LYMST